VTTEGEEEESIVRLARIGYDHVQGVLDGLKKWTEEGNKVETIETTTPEALIA
jgi:hypothetical protein